MQFEHANAYNSMSSNYQSLRKILFEYNEFNYRSKQNQTLKQYILDVTSEHVMNMITDVSRKTN